VTYSADYGQIGSQFVKNYPKRCPARAKTLRGIHSTLVVR
jgi:hypothetical protein